MTRSTYTTLSAVPRRAFLAGAAAAAALTLAACSSPGGVGGNEEVSEGGVEGERTGKTLVFYLSAGRDYKAYMDVIAAFEKEHNIKVDIQQYQWGDLKQKLMADFLSGSVPDITEEPGGFWSTRFGQQGDIMSLNNFLDKDPGFLDDFVPAGLEVRQADGQTYAIPLHLTMGGLVFANKEMLDAAGVAMPSTWDEFKSASKAIQDSGVEYGCALNNDFSYGIPWLLQNGVTYTTEGDTPMTPPEAAVEALNFQKDLIYTDHLAPVPVASNEYSAPRKTLTTKRAGLILTGPWDIGAIRKEDPDFPLAVGLPLKGKERKTTIAGSGLMIPAKSQNAELAWELIKAMTAPEVQEAVTEETGMAMSRKSWADSPVVKDDPILSVVAEARSLAVAPNRAFWDSENMAKIDEAEKTMYENVILNDKDAAAEVEAYNSAVHQMLG
ncbi:ABC transporter substrate-binding protein [Actinomyces vulturis]|uniref:ABC transporter substrate-binding protein n=1 Tax=Actinomyces vulturis TaxID=1857645 RepID=UPI00083621F7|nr:sugar ABC transporter substrate-binding protein [Actinomyces vulturis]